MFLTFWHPCHWYRPHWSLSNHWFAQECPLRDLADGRKFCISMNRILYNYLQSIPIINKSTFIVSINMQQTVVQNKISQKHKSYSHLPNLRHRLYWRYRRLERDHWGWWQHWWWENVMNWPVIGEEKDAGAAAARHHHTLPSPSHLPLRTTHRNQPCISPPPPQKKYRVGELTSPFPALCRPHSISANTLSPDYQYFDINWDGKSIRHLRWLS